MASQTRLPLFFSNYSLEEDNSQSYNSNVQLNKNITEEEKNAQHFILNYYQKKLISQLLDVFKIYDISDKYINQQNMYQNEGREQDSQNDELKASQNEDQTPHELYEFTINDTSPYDPVDTFIKISNQYFEVLKKQITNFIFQSIPTDPHMLQNQIFIVNSLFNKFNQLITDTLTILNQYPIQTCENLNSQVMNHFINKLIDILNHKYQNQSLKLQQNADVLPTNIMQCFSMLIIQAAELCLVTNNQNFDYVQINAIYQLLCTANQDLYMHTKIQNFINKFMNIYLSDSDQNLLKTQINQEIQPKQQVFKSLQNIYEVLNKKLNLQLPNVILIFLQIFQPKFCKNYKLFNIDYQAQSLIDFLQDSLIVIQDSSLLQSIIQKIMAHVQQILVQFTWDYDDIEYETLNNIHQLYKQVFGYQRIYNQDEQNDIMNTSTSQQEVRNITLERFIIQQYDNSIQSYHHGKISIIEFILIYYLQEQNFYWMKSHFNTEIRKQHQSFFINFRNVFFYSWGINVVTQWFENPQFDQQDRQISEVINTYFPHFDQKQVRQISITIFALNIEQQLVIDDLLDQLQQFMIRYGIVPQEMFDEICNALQKTGYLSSLINDNFQLSWQRLINQQYNGNNIINIEQNVEKQLLQFNNMAQIEHIQPILDNNQKQNEQQVRFQRIEGTGDINNQQFRFAVIMPISESIQAWEPNEQISKYNNSIPNDILNQVVEYFNLNGFQSFLCLGLPKQEPITTLTKHVVVQEPSLNSTSTTTMPTVSRFQNKSSFSEMEKEIKLYQLVLKAAIAKQIKILQYCTKDELILWGKLQDIAQYLPDQQIESIVEELIQENIISIENETQDNCMLIWGQK